MRPRASGRVDATDAEGQLVALSQGRGYRGEKRVEAATGAVRVKFRERYESRPDFDPLHHEPSGETLQFESKAGVRCVPRRILRDLAQARSYTPGAVPIAVYSDVRGDAVACLPLEALVRLLGLRGRSLQCFGDGANAVERPTDGAA